MEGESQGPQIGLRHLARPAEHKREGGELVFVGAQIGAEFGEVVFRSAGGAVAHGGRNMRVRMERDRKRHRPAAIGFPVQDGAKSGARGHPRGEIGRIGRAHALQRLGRRFPRCRGELLGSLRREAADAPPETNQQLVADKRAVIGFADAGKLVEELREGQRRVDDHRLHFRKGLDRLVLPYGVEDAEALLVDAGAAQIRAKARRPADHLVVEDAAVDPAQKGQVDDVWHVNASGEQIDGDGDLRQRIVAEPADHGAGPINAAGNLAHQHLVLLAVARLERGGERVDHHVRMPIGGREHQRLSRLAGVDMGGELFTHDISEGPGDDAAVEALDLETDVVGGDSQVHLSRERVEKRQLFAGAEMNAVARQLRLDTDRRFLIDEPSIDDRLAQPIGEDRPAEYLGRVQCRRRRQPNADRIEIFQDAAIFADVIGFRPEAQLRVAHFAIERVSAMAFVHDEQIVLVDWRRFLGRVRKKHPLHEPLYRADMNLGIRVGRHVAQHLQPEDVGESAGAYYPGGRERITRLVPQRGAIDDEANSLEPARVQQTVKQSDRQLGLASAGCHGEQQRAVFIIG